MSEQPNPYAPPAFDSNLGGPLLGGTSTGLRREGDLVMLAAEGTVFPPRCVVCNAPATKRLRRRLFWHPPGYYALALSPLIYAVVAMIVRKKATFEVGLCPAHAQRRLTGFLLGWIGTPVLFVAAVALADVTHGISLVLMLPMLGTMVAGMLMAQVVKAARIANGYAWLKVGRAFLDSL